jgi:Uma2 family endonuclease
MMGTPASLRWTSADLEVLPDDEKRYEIIDGELYVSKQPHWHHQATGGRVFAFLDRWSLETGLGEASPAPGVIFDDDDDVAPDVVWVSAARLAKALDESGKLRATPELVVEVLSPGTNNERRDREAKLKLYSRRGVDEYWIVDWRARSVDIYRRTGEALVLAEQLSGDATITSPLLPGFAASLTQVFPGTRRATPGASGDAC